MTCDCPLDPGLCPVHDLVLSARQRQQCRDEPGMFAAFARLGERRKRKPATARPRGLGDTVEGIAKRLRLDRAAKIWSKVTGKPCGCEGRRKLLNRLFPYGDG